MVSNKKLREFGRIFDTEVGEQPKYRWIRMRDSKLEWPAECYQAGTWPPEPIMDMVCNCGVNVRIHKPECKMSFPRRRHKMVHFFQIRKEFKINWEQDSYIVAQGVYQDPKQWEAVYGTIPYMKILWQPVQIEGIGFAITNPGEDPTIEATRALCWIIDYHRSPRSIMEADERSKRREEAKKKEVWQKNRTALDTIVGVRANPGKVDGDTSLPTPEFLKARRMPAKEDNNEQSV